MIDKRPESVDLLLPALLDCSESLWFTVVRRLLEAEADLLVEVDSSIALVILVEVLRRLFACNCGEDRRDLLELRRDPTRPCVSVVSVLLSSADSVALSGVVVVPADSLIFCFLPALEARPLVVVGVPASVIDSFSRSDKVLPDFLGLDRFGYHKKGFFVNCYNKQMSGQSEKILIGVWERFLTLYPISYHR